MQIININPNLIYPELSYKIVGLAFKVFNDVGYGMNEKFYQTAFQNLLQESKLDYKKEQLVKLSYANQPAGKYFLDFIVDSKVIVELKVRPRLGYVHIRQVMSYLKSTGHKLALLIYFTRDGIKYRRIVNAV